MRNVPSDYYTRLHAIERSHWWQIGMRKASAALLGSRLAGNGSSLLDAGCGSGGFIAWISESWTFDRLCGVDLSPEAIALARQLCPRAELHVAPLHELPFEDAEFDVVVTNDVLQHVDDELVAPSLQELHRVLRASGTLLVRTNAARHARRERRDWRVYDEQLLRGELENAGFRIVRMTHANAVLGAIGSLRGNTPAAPTDTKCGIPVASGRLRGAIGRTVLGLEAACLRRGLRLPYGHTLFALAETGEHLDLTG